MRVLALLPVRNEAWVLRETLICLSGFCDVILVGDQSSGDASRSICREFDRVVLVENDHPLVCEAARFQLLDIARDYDGRRLLWMTDADELVSAASARLFLDEAAERIRPATSIEFRWCQLFGDFEHYRDDGSAYAPQWKPMAFLDDGRADYDRSGTMLLHRSRVPGPATGGALRAENVSVLHLQWLLKRRNQTKQAWYRCVEWLDGKKSAAAINQTYAPTLVERDPRRRPVPHEWRQDITYPSLSIDLEPSWQERQVLEWFDEKGVTFFEPLEIWHVDNFRMAFRMHTGRSPRPDRSYIPPWPTRARRFVGWALRSAKLGLR
jgi:hypothetical protein